MTDRKPGLRHPGWQRRPAGFSLIGSLVTWGTTAFALLLVMPVFHFVTDRGEVELLQEPSLAAHLEYARQEAIRQETVVTVCPSRDGRSCQAGGDWRQGWLIFTDEVSPRLHFSVGDKLLYKQEGQVEAQPLVAAGELVQYQADGSIRLD